jgi:Concanavalin A-like lectin/glucanases superfamily
LALFAWAAVACTAQNPAFLTDGRTAGAGRGGAGGAAGRGGAGGAGDRGGSGGLGHGGSTPDVGLPGPEEGPPSGDAQSDAIGTGVDLLTGLVGYWRMDESDMATEAKDSSGLNNHGTLENVNLATAWGPGRFGRALQMDDNDKNAGIRVKLTDRIAGIKRYTVAAWVKRLRLRPTAYQSIISRQLSGGIAEVFDMSVSKDVLQIYGSDRNSMGVTSAFAPSAAPVNDWFHAAATFDGTTLRLYMNGELVDSAAFSLPLPVTDTPLYLGTNKNDSGLSNAHHPWEGSLDEILLYDLVLPAESIAALAAGERPDVP